MLWQAREAVNPPPALASTEGAPAVTYVASSPARQASNLWFCCRGSAGIPMCTGDELPLRSVEFASCHFMSRHVLSCHIMSMSCRGVSCRVVSCHVMPCVMSCRVMFFRVVSPGVVSGRYSSKKLFAPSSLAPHSSVFHPRLVVPTSHAGISGLIFFLIHCFDSKAFL